MVVVWLYSLLQKAFFTILSFLRILSIFSKKGQDIVKRQDSGILSFSISCPQHVGISTFSMGVLKSDLFENFRQKDKMTQNGQQKTLA
jgi:hypothetical protein